MIAEFRKLGLVRQFLYPSLLLFLIPGFSFWFFGYATNRYDQAFLDDIKAQIASDKSLTTEAKNEGVAFYAAHPVSKLLVSADPDDQRFVSELPDNIRFYYDSFRWLKALALVSLLAGVALYLSAGLAVLLSTSSPRAQYWSLLAGWHAIRGFMTLQVLIQAALLIGLSFWVTAIFFKIYIARLIIVVVVITLAAVLAVLKSLLKPVDQTTELSGKLVGRSSSPQLWEKLKALAARVGTAPPDQIILGIDQNFFVTEHPLIVNGITCRGRTLYMSLSMLKTMSEQESSAVLAHELAHFSGNDTLYSRKTGPLLAQFDNYLHALAQNEITHPFFYCAGLFRTLYESSLGKVSRDREFRADRIAAEMTAPEALTQALLRISTYSIYRYKLQTELFSKETTLGEMKIMQRIESGYYTKTGELIHEKQLMDAATAHPFDTHPPMQQRFDALKVSFDPATAAETLAHPGDGHWYGLIDQATETESELWQEYESVFSEAHQKQLALQYIPETDEERAVVQRFFPPIVLTCHKNEKAALDHEAIVTEAWGRAVPLVDITSIQLIDEWGVPVILITDDQGTVKLKAPKDKAEFQKILQQIQYYTGRAFHAREYQEWKKTQADKTEHE